MTDERDVLAEVKAALAEPHACESADIWRWLHYFLEEHERPKEWGPRDALYDENTRLREQSRALLTRCEQAEQIYGYIQTAHDLKQRDFLLELERAEQAERERDRLKAENETLVEKCEETAVSAMMFRTERDDMKAAHEQDVEAAYMRGYSDRDLTNVGPQMGLARFRASRKGGA